MRGVASGGDGNHSGSLPSVGMYLDEQPITTIQGALDIHIYDIDRVEALAGPQGTLYGASSQAGTIRIITNKPDPSGFAAGYALEVNTIGDGGIGHVVEGFVNIPLADNAAIRAGRLARRHDAGLHRQRAYGTRHVSRAGAACQQPQLHVHELLVCTGRAKDDYNDVDTTGARAALRIDLNDNWSITPTIMGQKQSTNGIFAFDPHVGDLEVTHFYPERSDDSWIQAALTVEGKIGNFDLTYAFAHLNRDDEVDSDYSDYSFWYDTLVGYGAYDLRRRRRPDQSVAVHPGQGQLQEDQPRIAHRLAAKTRFRFVGGVFWQEQEHDIQQRYRIDGLARRRRGPRLARHDLADQAGPRGPRPGGVRRGLLRHHRPADRDRRHALLQGRQQPEGLLRLREAISATIRTTRRTRSVRIPPRRSTARLAQSSTRRVRENDHIGKLNLTYEISDTKLIYATWSEGYRPGGINRRGTPAAVHVRLPDQLRVRLEDHLGRQPLGLQRRRCSARNGRTSSSRILGANGLTEIKNANQAQIDGLEMDLNWAATYNLRLSGGVAFYDAKLTENYCGLTDEAGNSVTDCPPGTLNPNGTFDDPSDDTAVEGPEAPDGTRLPVTPKFKGNLTARYTFDIGSLESYVQGAYVHVGERTSDLRLLERGILGDLACLRRLRFRGGCPQGQLGAWTSS